MEHGWVVGYDGKVETLFSTSDSGQHWTKIVPVKGPALNTFTVPDFTSVRNGWVLEYATDQKTKIQSTVLFKTSDGGYTWMQVHAMFPSFVVPKSAF